MTWHHHHVVKPPLGWHLDRDGRTLTHRHGTTAGHAEHTHHPARSGPLSPPCTACPTEPHLELDGKHEFT